MANNVTTLDDQLSKNGTVATALKAITENIASIQTALNTTMHRTSKGLAIAGALRSAKGFKYGDTNINGNKPDASSKPDKSTNAIAKGPAYYGSSTNTNANDSGIAPDNDDGAAEYPTDAVNTNMYECIKYVRGLRKIAKDQVSAANGRAIGSSDATWKQLADRLPNVYAANRGDDWSSLGLGTAADKGADLAILVDWANYDASQTNGKLDLSCTFQNLDGSDMKYGVTVKDESGNVLYDKTGLYEHNIRATIPLGGARVVQRPLEKNPHQLKWLYFYTDSTGMITGNIGITGDTLWATNAAARAYICNSAHWLSADLINLFISTVEYFEVTCYNKEMDPSNTGYFRDELSAGIESLDLVQTRIMKWGPEVMVLANGMRVTSAYRLQALEGLDITSASTHTAQINDDRFDTAENMQDPHFKVLMDANDLGATSVYRNTSFYGKGRSYDGPTGTVTIPSDIGYVNAFRGTDIRHLILNGGILSSEVSSITATHTEVSFAYMHFLQDITGSLIITDDTNIDEDDGATGLFENDTALATQPDITMKVTKRMDNLFNGCVNLKSVDLSKLKLDNDSTNTLKKCYNIEEAKNIPVNVKGCCDFRDQYKLTSLTFTGSKVADTIQLQHTALTHDAFLAAVNTLPALSAGSETINVSPALFTALSTEDVQKIKSHGYTLYECSYDDEVNDDDEE